MSNFSGVQGSYDINICSHATRNNGRKCSADRIQKNVGFMQLHRCYSVTPEQTSKYHFLNLKGNLRCAFFLSALAKLRKATINFVTSVCPPPPLPSLRASVSVEQLGSHWTDFIKFVFWIFFENLLKEKVLLKSDSTGTLHEDQCTFFFTVSRSILLGIRNVSDKSCRDNQNTHFVFSDFFFFSKIVLLVA